MTANMPDDELLDNLDDFQAVDGQDEAVRQARERAFQKNVKKNIAILLSPKRFDAKRRAEAARWLGESGEPEAIEPLLKVYQRPKEDEAVRAAAEEALGLFKALGQALEDPDMHDDALSLLEGIVYRGKMGKPHPLRGPRMRQLQIGLIVSALLLFVLGAAFSGPSGSAVEVVPTEEATPTPQPVAQTPRQIVEAFLDAYVSLDATNRQLVAQMSLAAQRVVTDCTLSLAQPTPFEADLALVSSDAQFALFGDALASYDAAQRVIVLAYDAFRAACDSGTPISPEDAARYGGQLLGAQANLDRLPVYMSAFGLSVPPTPTPITIPTATPSPTPTASPTPTVEPQEVRRQILGIQQILNAMTGQRGLNTLLLGYWNDAINNGSDAGCRQYPGMPLFPASAQIPVNVRNLLPDELNAAAEAANLGLSLSQQSWAAFISACNSRTLRDSAPSQIGLARQAEEAFNNAAALLQAAQQRLR
ncbi:MAG: HEAT repeat domain-containing protein [Anaerolineae bacterium]|nr:HEAT repeat domain-containing protein [Anaerolineae bacterium]MDW8173949.1 HEAT repeat domain-containing protein [Anaerolineae bacterium]